MLHHIQRSIIDQLGYSEDLQYSQLKPNELDGNVFGYHLKRAMAEGYVEKVHSTYKLTIKGKSYFVRRYENAQESAHTIFLVVVRNTTTGDWLLRKRKVQPLLGWSGFVHGEPSPMEPITATAATRLLEKTGLTDVDLSVKGAAMITQTRNGLVESFSNAVVLYGETRNDIAVDQDDTGMNFWSNNLSGDKILPSCQRLGMEIAQNKFFWFESTYDI